MPTIEKYDPNDMPPNCCAIDARCVLMKFPIAVPTTDAFHISMNIAPAPYKNENSTQNSSTLTLLKTISQLDTGSGASVDDVIMISKVSNAETFLQDMIMRGEIFEVKPGKYKMM